MSTETASEADFDDSEDRNRISETAIYVQIVKQGIPDVTLIDLPGINYTNETIKSGLFSLLAMITQFRYFAATVLLTGQIGDMYTKYIKSPSVIILNVISAVTDIKANESVLFAKKVCLILHQLLPFRSSKILNLCEFFKGRHRLV